MSAYELYYVNKGDRLESMMICSLCRDIDWCENGMRIVSWSYNKVAGGDAGSLGDVFKKYSTLNIDRRRKKQLRTICVGDVIVLDGQAWIVTAFGFSLVPDVLWKKVNFSGEVNG